MHNLFSHQDTSASQERVRDGPGRLGGVAGYKHSLALGINFQYFVGNCDACEENRSERERKQDNQKPKGNSGLTILQGVK